MFAATSCATTARLALIASPLLLATACGDGGGAPPPASASAPTGTAKATAPAATSPPAAAPPPSAPPPSDSASAAPTEAGAPVAAAKCPPDVKVDVPGLCIKVPTTYKADKVSEYTNGGGVSLKDGSKSVKLSWVKRSPPDIAEGVKEMEGSVKFGKSPVWGDTPGKGRWVRYETANGAKMELSAVVIGDLLISCATQDHPGACPSITAP